MFYFRLSKKTADSLQVPESRYLIDKYCDQLDSMKKHDLMPFAKILEANVWGVWPRGGSGWM